MRDLTHLPLAVRGAALMLCLPFPNRSIGREVVLFVHPTICSVEQYFALLRLLIHILSCLSSAQGLEIDRSLGLNTDGILSFSDKIPRSCQLGRGSVGSAQGARINN